MLTHTTCQTRDDTYPGFQISTHNYYTQNVTVAADKETEGLVEFFKVRNPTTDLSLNVDSLLTKPIVVSDPCASCSRPMQAVL